MCITDIYILLLFTGSPQSPELEIPVPLTHDTTNTVFMISWSQSDCAVQYVATIGNTSDDRAYPNITTTDNRTTVTFPTGVEFCVTVVGVDSIGRRGNPSEPKCYCECWCLSYLPW